MDASGRAKVLMIAPGCDGNDVGESWSCYQWVKGVSQYADVTLLTMARAGKERAAAELKGVNVVSWPELQCFGRFERFSSIAKPSYVKFYYEARRWIKGELARGRSWDIVHQVGPIALRYPCPAAGLGLKLVLGPMAGSLETPADFRGECKAMPWYVKLRVLDRLRLKFDPLLRKTFSDASLVLGVAPYVKDLVSGIGIRRFESMSETGVFQVLSHRVSKPQESEFRLLHVGRLVRTKGLRDAIRALGLLKRLHGDQFVFSLDVCGTGEDEQNCVSEAKTLGIHEYIKFHGKVKRADLGGLFQQADAFVFPSFREPSGNVVFEALQNGLPVITSDRGGPGYVVNERCGFRVPVESPEQYARALADAIKQLADSSDLRHRLSRGAHDRIRDVGLWSHKIPRLIQMYKEVSGVDFDAFDKRVCA